MPDRQKTLTEFIIEEQRRFPEATGDFTALLNYVRLACKRISFLVGRGALGGAHGSTGATNVQGETQQKLDVIANDIFLRTSEYGGNLAAMVSEEMDDVYTIPVEYPRGKYLLAFDPLDGSSNIDVNVSVGSIFTVLRAPDDAKSPAAADFLQPGTQQLCAGYAIYGPTTMLVLTVGRGVHGFTLDRGFGEADHAGRANGIRRQHTPGGVERDAAADRSLAGLGEFPALAIGREPDRLQPHRLEPRERNVDLRDVDLVDRTGDSGRFPQRGGGVASGLRADLIASRVGQRLGA